MRTLMTVWNCFNFVKLGNDISLMSQNKKSFRQVFGETLLNESLKSLVYKSTNK